MEDKSMHIPLTSTPNAPCLQNPRGTTNTTEQSDQLTTPSSVLSSVPVTFPHDVLPLFAWSGGLAVGPKLREAHFEGIGYRLAW